jgi:hypothetical protein
VSCASRRFARKRLAYEGSASVRLASADERGQYRDDRSFIGGTVEHDVTEGVDAAHGDFIGKAAEHLDSLCIAISGLPSLGQSKRLGVAAGSLVGVLLRFYLRLAGQLEAAARVVETAEAAKDRNKGNDSGAGIGRRLVSFGGSIQAWVLGQPGWQPPDRGRRL